MHIIGRRHRIGRKKKKNPLNNCCIMYLSSDQRKNNNNNWRTNENYIDIEYILVNCLNHYWIALITMTTKIMHSTLLQIFIYFVTLLYTEHLIFWSTWYANCTQSKWWIFEWKNVPILVRYRTFRTNIVHVSIKCKNKLLSFDNKCNGRG